MSNSFARRLWGYRRDEVENYIKKLISEHEKTVSALEAERSQQAETNDKLKTEVESLQAELARYQAAEKAIAEAFIQAQMQAAAIEEEARKQAGEIEKAATAEVVAKKVELKNLRCQYIQAQEDFRRLVEKYTLLMAEYGEPGQEPEESPEPQEGDSL
jgi:cell division septum initiation protein DivIVA